MSPERLAIGVDIGGTNIRAAVVHSDGAVGQRVKFATRPERGADAVVEELADHLKQLLAKAPAEIVAVGVGCPGPLDSERGLIYEAPNLPGWNNYPLRDRIAERIGLPVLIQNDANAAAWGEFRHGAGRGTRTIILYTLGTGVGGGLVIDGRLWTGPDDTAGELGHVCIFPDGVECGCGARGCLEAYASATAVARRAREALAIDRASALAKIPPEQLTAHDVDHAADAGDPLAIELLEQTGRYLGLAAAALVNALNPDLIIYGGGMVEARRWLFPAIEREIQARCFEAPKRRVKVVPAALGDDAGIVGAADLALRR